MVFTEEGNMDAVERVTVMIAQKMREWEEQG
jgi:hypothetical protein